MFYTCSIHQNEYPELHKLVTTVQAHHHTSTCRKKKGVKCRFNIPWPPSEQTRIVRANVDEDKLNESKKIVDKVLIEITHFDDLSDVTLEDVLETCNVSESEYYDALNTMQKKLSIFYKRRPCENTISPYNTVILSLLKSNMNIQFVTGIYGLLTYLTSYLCKPEHKTSELMKKASKEATGKEVKGKLRVIGNVLTTKREISTFEAIKRVLSLPMRTSNIDTLYIPTGLKKNRTRMLKSQSALEMMHPDDTNIYTTNMLEKYACRPDDLEEMCYADFATNYISTKAEDMKIDSEDIRNYTTSVSTIEDVEPTSNVITLKDELGKMRKRTRPSVMRYHKVTKLKDSEQYHLKLLQLYMPWRNEEDILGDCHTYQEKFEQVETTIKPNIYKHDIYFGKYDIDEDDLLPVYENSDAESEENDADFGMLNPDLLDLDMDEGHDGNTSAPVASTAVQIQTLPPEQFYHMCSQLNELQQHLFNVIMKFAVMCKLCEKNDEPMPKPFHIFLSGGAGVGKTFVVNLMTDYLKKVLRYPGQNPDEQPSVVVTASTGKAATNVNGTTLHSAFKLPTPQSWSKVLKGEDLQRFRNKYKYLKVLVIDEVSMIGKPTFDDLNRHLQKIMDNNSDFGGVSILVVGDFFQLPPVRQCSVVI